MCLLDEILEWDTQHVSCQTRSQLREDNPLRQNGRLSTLHLIEYGAQAAAVHGGVLARENEGSCASPGMIAGLRDCRWFVPRLDTIQSPIQVMAHRMSGGAGGWIYRYEANAHGQLLGHGRVVIMPLLQPLKRAE